jgi:hypothetical protein
MLSLHMPTSNSSSTANFPWLSPTENWTLVQFSQMTSHSRILLYPLGTGHIENTASSLLLRDACVGTCLPSCCLALFWSNPLQYVHEVSICIYRLYWYSGTIWSKTDISNCNTQMYKFWTNKNNGMTHRPIYLLTVVIIYTLWINH